MVNCSKSSRPWCLRRVSIWFATSESWPRQLNNGRPSCRCRLPPYSGILRTSKQRRRAQSAPTQLHVVSVDGAGVRARCVGVSPLRLADAHSGGHRGSRRSPKDSRLPRLAVAAPAGGSCSPQPPTQPQRILTANPRTSPMCTSAPVYSGPGWRPPLSNPCAPWKRSLISNPTKLYFDRLRARIFRLARRKYSLADARAAFCCQDIRS